ncbi:MAG: hypothetical protein BJ554DRAFT_7641 [Olpidium bornovanus]|uniref:Uncharacterized protein n=1 Tax=Olpidium bornovanus TaxID=278681 RepID=A0A8H8A2D2_9FUNG|nr:MAG: hypothetical protein BJ554DRAFT_7641 [Olpidium bornovanus]
MTLCPFWPPVSRGNGTQHKIPLQTSPAQPRSPALGRPHTRPRRFDGCRRASEDRFAKLPEISPGKTSATAGPRGADIAKEGIDAAAAGGGAAVGGQANPRDSITADAAGNARNPFHMPSDEDIFAMRDQERQAKAQAKEQIRRLSVYEKGVVKRKNFKALLAENEDEVDKKLLETLKKRDADKILINRQTRGTGEGCK